MISTELLSCSARPPKKYLPNQRPAASSRISCSNRLLNFPLLRNHCFSRALSSKKLRLALHARQAPLCCEHSSHTSLLLPSPRKRNQNPQKIYLKNPRIAKEQTSRLHQCSKFFLQNAVRQATRTGRDKNLFSTSRPTKRRMRKSSWQLTVSKQLLKL